VFRMDVAKVDQDVSYVTMVVHICCVCLFLMFHLFLNVCCKCVYLDVAYRYCICVHKYVASILS
jgi:hypothetical protein